MAKKPQNVPPQQAGTRTRVKELRHMNPKDLTVNPNNWRLHDQTQRDAFKSILDNVGFAGTIIAYESERNNGNLMVIDGHMRLDEIEGDEVPVVILDVTDEEADLLLATYDPVGNMASSDAEILGNLLANIQSDDLSLQTLLADIDEQFGLHERQLPVQQTDADFLPNPLEEDYAGDSEEDIEARQKASEGLRPLILYIPISKMEELREKIRILSEKFELFDTASVMIKLIDDAYETNK